MTTTKDAFRQAAEFDDGSYPKSWIPEPRDFIVGTLDHYDTGASRFGTRNIAVIRDEESGELRSVWLMASVLEAKFAELEPKPGERLYVKRHADRVNAVGTTYQTYSVRVEGRTTKPRFDRVTEVPPQQQAETPECESRPAPEEEVAGSHEPEKFTDFPEPLVDDNGDDDGDDDDDDLPF